MDDQEIQINVISNTPTPLSFNAGNTGTISPMLASKSVSTEHSTTGFVSHQNCQTEVPLYDHDDCEDIHFIDLNDSVNSDVEHSDSSPPSPHYGRKSNNMVQNNISTSFNHKITTHSINSSNIDTDLSSGTNNFIPICHSQSKKEEMSVSPSMFSKKMRRDRIGIVEDDDDSGSVKLSIISSEPKRTVSFATPASLKADALNHPVPNGTTRHPPQRQPPIENHSLPSPKKRQRKNLENISIPSVTVLSTINDSGQLDLPSPTPSSGSDKEGTTPKLKSALVHRTPSTNGIPPDSDELKSVKFQSFNDSPNPNGFKSFIDPGKLSSPKLDKQKKSATVMTATQEVKSDIFSDKQQGKAEKPTEKSSQLKKRSHGSISFAANPTHIIDDIHSPTTVRTGLCRCANLSTQRGRRNHALMIMLVSVVPVIALLVQNSIDVFNHNQNLNLQKGVRKEILFRAHLVHHVIQIF